MKAAKKTVCAIAAALVVVLLVTAVLLAGASVTTETKKKGDPTRLTYDSTADFGLYWYGGNSASDYIRSSEKVDVRYFDPSKPTMIFFHGWNFAGENKNAYYPLVTTENTKRRTGCAEVSYADRLLDEGYNVGEFNWSAYAEDILELFTKLWVEFNGGDALIVRFAKEYGAFLGDYDGHVTFYGHSYGAQAAIGTAYMLNKLYDEGTVESEACLPDRFTLADPYIGDLTLLLTGTEDLQKKIDYLDEDIAGRWPSMLFADCLDYLTERGALCDIYCGMPMAYEGSLGGDTELCRSTYERIYADCTWTVLKGLQDAFGTVGDIHNMTGDWALLSLFTEKKNGDVYYPTAGLSDEKLSKLVGKRYETQYKGLNLDEEIFVEVENQ